jgi:hypothetical protein
MRLPTGAFGLGVIFGGVDEAAGAAKELPANGSIALHLPVAILSEGVGMLTAQLSSVALQGSENGLALGLGLCGGCLEMLRSNQIASCWILSCRALK